MEHWVGLVQTKLVVDGKLILIYALTYFAWGTIMNKFGAAARIARFTYWWQVITVYLLYMVPVSLLLRGRPLHVQYAYGMVAMAFLEFGGYALKSSYAYEDNILDKMFGVRNFSLGMTIFFALYFPAGNWIADTIYAHFLKS